MKQSRQSARCKLWQPLLLGLALLLAGCATTESNKTTSNQKAPIAPPSSNIYLGKIVHVDKEEGIAVIMVEARRASIQGNLLARDIDLQPTAILKTEPFYQGRALGVSILQGEPQAGDEVVLPGATTAAMIRKKLADSTSAQ